MLKFTHRAIFGTAFFALCFPALTATASAGDTAELNILGFSTDGGIFAFEEYGVQDGSGFPYANRFYIHTATDEFVDGSPVRVALEDENANVSEARKKAREAGEKIVPQDILDANRGFTAAFNAVTELNADPLRIVASPQPYFPPIEPPVEFRLEELLLPGGEQRCFDLGELKGFRLLSVDAENGKTEVLHEDKSVPQSRGCAIGYRLGGLQTFGPQHFSAYAVLVAIQRVGFEGPDFRWIAVTGRR